LKQIKRKDISDGNATETCKTQMLGDINRAVVNVGKVAEQEWAMPAHIQNSTDKKRWIYLELSGDIWLPFNSAGCEA